MGFDEDDDEPVEIVHLDSCEEGGLEYAFDLMTSEDAKVVALTCTSERELEPAEYCAALRAFLEYLEGIEDMRWDEQSDKLN